MSIDVGAPNQLIALLFKRKLIRDEMDRLDALFRKYPFHFDAPAWSQEMTRLAKVYYGDKRKHA